MGENSVLRKKYCLRFFIYFLFFLVSISCKKSSKDFVFASIGDIHYKSPDFRIADYFVSVISNELDCLKIKPEFIIQTGDFFDGSKETDIESEAAFAFKNFDKNIDIPFFIAKGNHDVRDYYEKIALPIFSQELGSDVVKSFYSFNKSNCHFIILDCTDEKLIDQLIWLKNDLEMAKSDFNIEHIFVAGHYPLWIVARSGFTRSEYAIPVASLLALYKVDAYFCGHTHNKTTTVQLINGQPLLQIMDAGVVEEGRLFNLAPFLHHVNAEPKDLTSPGIMPLEDAHHIFIEPSKLKYYWGYQEGSTSSYSIITVRGVTVQVDYHVLGKGIVRSYKWDKPGELVNLKEPGKVKMAKISDENFANIEKAWLYAGIWLKEENVKTPFFINGVDAGNLDVSRKAMAYSPFWSIIEIPLGKKVISVLKKKNVVRISNQNKYEFGLAHVFIMFQLNDGRFAKSTISPFVITSFEPTEKGKNFPDEKFIKSVEKGDNLEEVTLNFNDFVQR